MFKVGQRVLCINDTPPTRTREDTLFWAESGQWNLQRGRIYVIREIDDRLVGRHPAYKSPNILLEEIVCKSYFVSDGYGTIEAGFSARRFQPVDEGRLDALRELLKIEA